jgi:hypothetical protein
MATSWSDLSERQRRFIIGVAAVETAAKVAMLIDLKRRRPDQVRGSRALWASTALINSAGLLPAAYFLVGRLRVPPGV